MKKRALAGVVSMASLVLITGCSSSSGASTQEESQGGSTDKKEQRVFPEPTDPTIQGKEGDFPVELRPVGRELSPVIGEGSSAPGKARLGVLFEVRATTEDRPTPLSAANSFGTWIWSDHDKKAEDCEREPLAPEPEDGCPEESNTSSAIFDESTANSGGIEQFYPKVIEETVEGQAEEMQHGTSYYVEIFGEEVPESTNIEALELCNELDPDHCVDLKDLEELPKRKQ